MGFCGWSSAIGVRDRHAVGSTGRGEDYRGHPVPSHGGQEVDATRHVVPIVLDGIYDRLADVSLGPEVHYGLEGLAGEELVERLLHSRVREIGANDFHARGRVLVPFAQVVKDHDALVELEQLPQRMAAHITRPPGNEKGRHLSRAQRRSR